MKKYLILCPIVLVSVLIVYFVFFHKHRTVDRAFYYWKSVYAVSSDEEKLLDSLHIKKMYVKYFDVDWDAATQLPVPKAVINFSSHPGSAQREIVPTVYITNKTIKNIAPGAINDLAGKISHLIASINKNEKITAKEIQFDCDWSETTREKYFDLIKAVKKNFVSKTKFSATIRLHQVKYYNITGIPPVDRGMLMFYNMGDLNNSNSTNSIYDETLAKKYVSYVHKYPLKLDVALPVFCWGVHLRDGKVNGLVNNIKTAEVDTVKYFHHSTLGYYVADDGFFFRGDYFMKGDVLRMEEITPELCENAQALLSSELPSSTFTLTLYHFDKSNTSRYVPQDFEKIFTGFN